MTLHFGVRAQRINGLLARVARHRAVVDYPCGAAVRAFVERGEDAVRPRRRNFGVELRTRSQRKKQNRECTREHEFRFRKRKRDFLSQKVIPCLKCKD